MPPKDTIACEKQQDGKKVYYVLRRQFENRYVGSAKMVRVLAEARLFPTMEKVMVFLTRHGAGHVVEGYDFVKIVRVEETITKTPARRELVTSGDLSLLNGPCVLQSGAGPFLCGMPGDEWRPFVNRQVGFRGSWVGLADATVYPNQGMALKAMAVQGHLNGSSHHQNRIIPIREVPGDTTVDIKETVLE